MGWHPDQVRSLSLDDFVAAFDGWREAHVPQDGHGLSLSEISDLRAMLNEG